MENHINTFKDYLEKEKKYSQLTTSAYCRDLQVFAVFIAQEFKQDNITAINYPQIRAWIVALIENNNTASTVNRKIASLKAFYKFLLKTHTIAENPLQKHIALKKTKNIQIPFSNNEMQILDEQNEFPIGYQQIRDKLIIELFYTTGIRRAELIELKNSQVDITNQTIKVIGKRNKERIIPLLPTIIEQITNYQHERISVKNSQNNPYFFLTTKGLKLNESLVYRLINSYFSKVSEKVKKSPHILRHTFATHLLDNGADLNAVKELLGHSSLASTQIYINSSLSELKKVYGNSHPRSNNPKD
jgi:integrase/recombinase XerC